MQRVPTITEIESLIFDAIDELNAQRAENRQIEKSADTALFGLHIDIDSLDLVNLMVSVEQRVSDVCGVAVTLADEKAMSRNSSPFRTVLSLTAYVRELLEQTAGE